MNNGQGREEKRRQIEKRIKSKEEEMKKTRVRRIESFIVFFIRTSF